MGKPTKPTMTYEEARETTDRIRGHVEQAWELLARIHAEAGWRVLGYGSFEAYVLKELEISRSQAYRLVDQGKVIRALQEALPQVSASQKGDSHTPLGVNERQARQLRPVLPKVVEALQEAGSAPKAEQTKRARRILQDHLARPPAKKTKPRDIVVVQAQPLYPPPQTAEHVRILVARIVEQTADRLAHCCNVDQLSNLADRAVAAYEAKSGKAWHGDRPHLSLETNPNRCPSCRGITGDAGKGNRKCRNCGWTGKVA